MDYKNYQAARDAVWKLLIDTGVNSLPVPIISICKYIGAEVRYDPALSGSHNCGYTTIVRDKAFIVIDPKMSLQRKRFTLAHEVGHILLGHVGRYQLVARGEPDPKDNPVEQEANVFASRLLAPACVLWGCKIKNPGEIARLCGISLTAAEYRFERYQQLLVRNKFLTSELERQVYRLFTDFIQCHQQQKDH